MHKKKSNIIEIETIYNDTNEVPRRTCTQVWDCKISLLDLVFLMKEERWVVGEDSGGGKREEGDGEGEGIFLEYFVQFQVFVSDINVSDLITKFCLM